MKNEFQFLLQAFQIAQIPFKLSEPLSAKSTFKVGGQAEVFVTPENQNQLLSAIGGITAAGAKYFILGGGSNIVFPDNTYEGIILSTQNINNIYMDTDNSPQPGKILVTCECGTPISAFVNFCTKKNLSGAEQFAGLPGTVGGAVYMNARCFEKSISDILYSTQHIDYSKPTNAKIIENPYNANEWDYKKSPFQQGNKLITSATFILNQKTPEEHQVIETNCKKYINERVSKGHFNYPSAGSVFKNNRSFGKPSGQIIDEAGLKGFQIGGAQIAPFHGNFIINVNSATASDIKKLVEHTQKVVAEKFNFTLEPEIIFIE